MIITWNILGSLGFLLLLAIGSLRIPKACPKLMQAKQALDRNEQKFVHATWDT